MIYYIIGIRRSGLHAIANWLFPMMGEYIYLNNYELGKLQENELVVNGNFNVIIGLENKPVEEVLKYTNKGRRIWVVRHELQMIYSQREHYKNAGLPPEKVEKKVRESIHLLDDYMNYIGLNSDEDFPILESVINYEAWNEDLEYRKKTAEKIGLHFNDSNKEKIFGYGVSSYK